MASFIPAMPHVPPHDLRVREGQGRWRTYTSTGFRRRLLGSAGVAPRAASSNSKYSRWRATTLHIRRSVLSIPGLTRRLWSACSTWTMHVRRSPFPEHSSACDRAFVTRCTSSTVTPGATWRRTTSLAQSAHDGEIPDDQVDPAHRGQGEGATGHYLGSTLRVRHGRDTRLAPVTRSIAPPMRGTIFSAPSSSRGDPNSSTSTPPSTVTSSMPAADESERKYGVECASCGDRACGIAARVGHAHPSESFLGQRLHS